MKIGIFTGGTSVRLKNIFTAISRYPTGKREINHCILVMKASGERCTFWDDTFGTLIFKFVNWESVFPYSAK